MAARSRNSGPDGLRESPRWLQNAPIRHRDIFWKIPFWTFFVKIDPICHLRPSHHYENDRKWILLIWLFHQNHHFICIFTVHQPLFHEKSLFHFKLSQATFDSISSFLLGCLHATYYSFPEKHDPAILHSLDIACFESRSRHLQNYWKGRSILPLTVILRSLWEGL